LTVCPHAEVLVSSQGDLGGDTPPDNTSDLIATVEALRAKLREARKRGLTREEQAVIERLMMAIGALLAEARYLSEQDEGGPASLS
jgi:hypothetical protein